MPLSVNAGVREREHEHFDHAVGGRVGRLG
jgi:hypothetical protein